MPLPVVRHRRRRRHTIAATLRAHRGVIDAERFCRRAIVAVAHRLPPLHALCRRRAAARYALIRRHPLRMAFSVCLLMPAAALSPPPLRFCRCRLLPRCCADAIARQIRHHADAAADRSFRPLPHHARVTMITRRPFRRMLPRAYADAPRHATPPFSACFDAQQRQAARQHASHRSAQDVCSR